MGMSFKEIGMIATGFFWCVKKGIFLMVPFLRPADREWQMVDDWGWHDPGMDIIWEEQTTLPRGGVSHHRTDLVVEWCKLSPGDRAPKIFCALIFLGTLFGLLGGLSIGWWIYS